MECYFVTFWAGGELIGRIFVRSSRCQSQELKQKSDKQTEKVFFFGLKISIIYY